MTAVELKHVTKTYGEQVAVDDLSLSVPPGTVYGFIGPNGSGKTTTLRMIMHILHPDSGEIRVLGRILELESCSIASPTCPKSAMLYKQMKRSRRAPVLRPAQGARSIRNGNR